MDRLGRYLLIRSLASGGMGEIYLAEHTGIAGFAKRVALKRIRPELARDSAYVQLFLNEARLGSFLNHPNIVHIFDVGHAEDELWMVMEYVDGVDLKRLQRRASLSGHPLEPITIAAIMIDVLAALDEAHRGGPLGGAPIIHRDMSPENVLIARSGAVKVLDFGLAKWVPESSSVPSMEGNMIFGKVRYMPPEQLKGHLIDVRADLFSLGVVMYETLQGDLPFGRGTANQVLARIMAGRPGSPTQRRFGGDADMDRIIMKATHPDADQRYQSAVEMRAALVDYIEKRGDRRLPMEKLRTMLQPGAALDSRGDSGGLKLTPEEAGELPGEERAPTEIALSVVERCGKCGGEFSALFLDGLIVDRCSSCRGVWLDYGELDRIIGHATESETMLPGQQFTPAPLDRLVGSCPTCRIGLMAYAVPGQPASLEICPRCLGVWFDAGELRLLSEGGVVGWLHRLIDSLRAP
jgi:serine/threonine protein kinase/Zn-finger nucleic acid-binding protein